MKDIDAEELARQERNRYQREWRNRNKDRVKAINQRYWEKKAAEAAMTAEQEQ